MKVLLDYPNGITLGDLQMRMGILISSALKRTIKQINKGNILISKGFMVLHDPGIDQSMKVPIVLLNGVGRKEFLKLKKRYKKHKAR